MLQLLVGGQRWFSEARVCVIWGISPRFLGSQQDKHCHLESPRVKQVV